MKQPGTSRYSLVHNNAPPRGGRALYRRPQSRGLLLLEACIALAIISVAVVWMLRSFSETALAVERLRDQSHAIRLLQAQRIIVAVHGGVAATPDTGPGDAPGWIWSVTPLDAVDTSSSLIPTQFTVTWQQRKTAHTLTAVTWFPQSASP